MRLDEMLLNEVAIQQSDKLHWALEQLDYRPDVEHVKMIVDESKKKQLEPELCIAIVASESSFRPTVVHYNGGSNDYGLFQLNNLWHNQHKGNVPNHIRAGVEHFKWCMKTEKNDVNRALSRYNTGGPSSAAGRQYARYVLGNKSKIDNKANQYASHLAAQMRREAAQAKLESDRQKKRRLAGTEGM